MIPDTSARRPLRTRLLIYMFFFLAVWNLAQVVILVQEYSLLAEQGLANNTIVRLILAMGWAVGFLLLTLGLWREWSWTRPGGLLLFTAYALYNLLLLFLFVQSPVERQAWPARLLGYIIVWALTAWWLYRPGKTKPRSSPNSER